jgi:demethylmenaquinone methyltransferase/2-methoxy-6-polyprenyl-1,4-benzoquinol methylase
MDILDQLRPGDRLLDLATGTADVAIIAAHGLQKLGSSGAVVGLDPSQGMLDVGQRKLEELELTSIVQLVHGDAQDMSALLPSDSFDKISMSFGIRNVEDRAAAMREMHRVLRKSNESVVGILEFSLPTSGILKPVGHFMIRYGAPLIGSLVTGLKDEYMHLQRSILNFPEPPEFAKLMGTCGLDVFDIKETGFGAVSLYLARPKLA